MEPVIKQILDALIEYASTRKTTHTQLKKADEELGGFKYMISVISEILHWNNLENQSLLKLDPVKLLLIDNDVRHGDVFKKRLQVLIETAPILTELFQMDEDYLRFNDTLTEEAVSQIQNYITDNYSPKKTSVYIRPDKKKH